MATPSPQKDGTEMPKLDLSKDQKFLSKAQMDYIRLAQHQNAERVNKLKKLRKTNLLTAGLLGTSVLAIFGYSIWAVGSEKFLDDFNEVAPPTQSQKN